MDEQPKKKRPGRWKPGESGNIAGKPKGCGQVQKLRAALGERLDHVLEVVLAQAMAGDMQAARIVLERVLPALRPAEQPVEMALPDGSPAAQGRAVMRAVAQAELSVDQGARLIASLGALARVIEVDELEARIRALEIRSGQEGETP